MSDKQYRLFEKLIKHFHALYIESGDFFRVGRFACAVFCLHYLLPYVVNIGKTLNGIGLPMVPFLPMVRTPNACFVSLSRGCI